MNFSEPPSAASREFVHMEAAPGTLSRYDGLLALEDRLGGIVAGDRADADQVGSGRDEPDETTVDIIKLVVLEGAEVRILGRCDWHVHFYSPVFQPAHHERVGGGNLSATPLHEVI